MKKIIEAKNIIKVYGDKAKVKALNGVSLTVNESDFVCIMGPSGTGKSTFLNILATIDRPNGGEVKINDKNVTIMSEKEISRLRYENIGFVFQEFNLIDSLTIRENIGVPLVLANKDKEYINKKVEAISKDLNIHNLLDKFPSECSGGQKQRAAICRALVTNPKMIVADEPTGSLDTKSSHELLKILQERNEKDGIAILMVTHDSMIASYSKKLVFLRDGKIDEEIERKSLTQKEFFYKIVDTTSRESQSLFEAL